MITSIAHFSSLDATRFSNMVSDCIEEFQKINLVVEIQYSTNTSGYQTRYSAVVIGRKSDKKIEPFGKYIDE